MFFDARDQETFDSIGRFLSDHRLMPTPANYTVAHAFVARSDPGLVAAVDAATFGDVRLSQQEADRIFASVGDRTSAGDVCMSVADLSAAIEDARARFDRYAGIVDASHDDARAYGVALEEGVARLAPIAPGRADPLATLLSVTHSMIDKTRSAEGQLRVASREMADLRASLAAARQDAETDVLTGLPNRRAFETAFARCDADRRVLAMCDIDRFKTVNDRYGHDVGDRVIRLVARELVDGCDGALVARYGGEEFVALFTGCGAETAARLLDGTRASVSRRVFRVAGTGSVLDDLSFSGGVVPVREGESVRDAARRADAALYRAKQGGRNRIEHDD